MTGKHFRLAIGYVCKIQFDGLDERSVEYAARFTQQRPIGGFLDQGMIEDIICLGWLTLSKQQARGNEAIRQALGQ